MQPTPLRTYILFLSGQKLDPQPPIFYGFLVDENESYIVNQNEQPIEYPTT